MIQSKYHGRFCRFAVGSDDFSTPAAVVIYDEDGGTITLTGTQRLVIHTLVVDNGGTARVVTLFDDADAGGDADAAEILWRGAMAANQHDPVNYEHGLLCGKGRAPKVLAAGASTGSFVSGTGEITR